MNPLKFEHISCMQTFYCCQMALLHKGMQIMKLVHAVTLEIPIAQIYNCPWFTEVAKYTGAQIQNYEG